MILIESWPKSELPFRWNGQRPVHILPKIDEIDNEKLSIQEVREKIVEKRLDLTNKSMHFHIIINGAIAFNSAFIKSY